MYIEANMTEGEPYLPEATVSLDRFALHERCLQEGVCPVCFATLEIKSYRERICPRCKFRHYNATPERKPHATE